MFNSKQEVIQGIKRFSKEHKVPVEYITVGGGAAMVLMGLRESTDDLNLWVEEDQFMRLAEDCKVLVHPLRDTVIQLPTPKYYIRRRNMWFNHAMIEGFKVFDVMGLILQKRGGCAEHHRPLAKRQQDMADLKLLAEIHAERYKVSA